jgi:hypothetical protein
MMIEGEMKGKFNAIIKQLKRKKNVSIYEQIYTRKKKDYVIRNV